MSTETQSAEHFKLACRQHGVTIEWGGGRNYRINQGGSSVTVRLIARSPRKTADKKLHWKLEGIEDCDFVATMQIGESVIQTWIIPSGVASAEARDEAAGPHLYPENLRKLRRFRENWIFDFDGNAVDEFNTQLWADAHFINLAILNADGPLACDEILETIRQWRFPITDSYMAHLRRLEGSNSSRPDRFVTKIEGDPVRWLRQDHANRINQVNLLSDDTGAAIIDAATEAYELSDEDTRAVVQRQIRERRGQQKFRDGLLARFERQCVVTGCAVLAVLEAAHICPYRRPEDNYFENGLLLRADIHTLFDLNLLGIEPGTWQIHIHPRIKPGYAKIAGKVLRMPIGIEPSAKAVKSRFEQFLENLGAA